MKSTQIDSVFNICMFYLNEHCCTFLQWKSPNRSKLNDYCVFYAKRFVWLAWGYLWHSCTQGWMSKEWSLISLETWYASSFNSYSLLLTEIFLFYVLLYLGNCFREFYFIIDSTGPLIWSVCFLNQYLLINSLCACWLRHFFFLKFCQFWIREQCSICWGSWDFNLYSDRKLGFYLLDFFTGIGNHSTPLLFVK